MKWNNVVGKFPSFTLKNNNKKKNKNSLASKAKENIKCTHYESKKIVLTFFHQSGSLVLAAYVKLKGGSLCSLCQCICIKPQVSGYLLLKCSVSMVFCLWGFFFLKTFSFCFWPLSIQRMNLLTKNKTSQCMKKNKKILLWFKTSDTFFFLNFSLFFFQADLI